MINHFHMKISNNKFFPANYGISTSKTCVCTVYVYICTVYALQTYESENIFNDAFKLKKLLLKMHLCTSSKTSGVGHTHVHHKVLLEIITPKAVVLPIDSDKNDCI